MLSYILVIPQHFPQPILSEINRPIPLQKEQVFNVNKHNQSAEADNFLIAQREGHSALSHSKKER